MPRLDVERWRELTPHLDKALDLTGLEREEWLASLARSAPALAKELDTFLAELGAIAREALLEESLGDVGEAFAGRAADSPMASAAPRYQIGQELARGGMGRILRAEDTQLGRTVAIKELLHEGEIAEARFLREAKLTARLQHPAIVPVHDAGRWNATGKPFYSMKLVSGEALGEVVERTTSLRERLALLPNVLAVADAVAYAHSQRVIHRDLKPANVLVGAYGETLVVDWGLAKELAEPAGAMEMPQSDAVERSAESSAPALGGARDRNGPLASPRDLADMTAVGTVLGTLAFMPPEQANGLEVDERADVYALGALLYFVVCAQAPYDGSGSRGLLERVRTQAPLALLAREPEVPPDLCAIVDKAMARNVSGRYSSAGEMASDLRRFLAGQLVSAHAYSWRQIATRWIQRHRAVTALSLVFVLAAALGTTAFVVRERTLRRAAESASVLADAQSRALLIEHGRRELSQGRPMRAAVYLSEAYQHDPQNLSLRYLMTDAVRPLAAHAHALRGHGRDVVAVSFSADGGRVATGSSDETVRLWNTESGAALAVLQGAASSIEDVAWSPDGRLVASVEDILCIWDAHTGSLLQKLPYPGFRLRFSNDGRWLAVGTMSGRLRVWDTATWTLAVDTRPHSDRLSAIAFSPDGTRVVTTGWDGLVRFWELPSWRPLQTLDDHRNMIGTAAFSSDGRWLLTGDSDVTLHVRDARAGAVSHTIRLPEGSRWMSASFTADGREIVTGTADGVIRVWHSASGSLLSSIDVIADGKLFDSALSPDGVTVATAGLDGADLWRLDASAGTRILRGAGQAASTVYSAFESADRARIVGATGSDASNAYALNVWDGQTGSQLASWPLPASAYALAASADLSRAVTGYGRNAATLWDVPHRRLLAHLDNQSKWVRSVAISADGSLVATGTDEGIVRFWDGGTGAPVGLPVELGASCTALAFSPDRSRLASADGEGRWRVHDLATRALLVERKGHSTWIEDIEYSPDGVWLVTAGRQDHTARIWNAQSSELKSTLTGHGDNLIRASFNSDASLVATVSVDNTARIWNAATGEILRVIRGPAYSARFSRDGRELLTAGNGDYLVAWDVALDQRSPEALAQLVRSQSPWHLEHGQLVSTPAARQF